jgi:hypothetical protein
MKVVPAIRRDSRRAVVIDQPDLLVVETDSLADPGSIEDALVILVRWALRAKGRGNPVGDEASLASACTTHNPGDST